MARARPVCLPAEAMSHLLFSPDPPLETLDPFRGYQRIYSFHGDAQFVSNVGSASPTLYRDPRPGHYVVDHLAEVLESDGIPIVIRAPVIDIDGAPGDTTAVYFHPGGGTGRKRWPLHNYAPLIAALKSRFPDIRAVLLLGEAEADIPGAFKSCFDQVLESPPLESLPALLSGRPYLGMDSGITHLAAASGATVLALFGPTDPLIWAQPRPNCTFLAASDISSLDMREVLARMSSLIRHGTTS